MATALNGRLIRQTNKEPLKGVTVEAINVATGVSGGSAATDVYGFYQITSLANATYFAKPLVPGDDWVIQPDTNKIIGGTLAFGSPPPTSATVGTGIWLDNTGLYGLNANVQQFYVSATDGKGYFGAGNVVLDSTGIVVSGNASLSLSSTYTSTTGVNVINAAATFQNTGNPAAGNDYVALRGYALKDAGAGLIQNLMGVRGHAEGTAAIAAGVYIGGYFLGHVNNASASPSGVYGAYTTGDLTSGAATSVFGTYSVGNIDAGTATSVYGLHAVASGTGGTATSGIGLQVDVTYGTNRYGVYINSPSASANYWALYSPAAAQSAIAGNLRIGGTTAPTVALDVTGAALISSTLGVTGALTFNGGASVAPGTWSPTWAGLTIGNGTTTARYEQRGKHVEGFAKFVLGSTSAVTGAVTFTLPVTAQAAVPVGGGQADNFGVAAYPLFCTLDSTTVAHIYIDTQPVTNLSATAPFTFGTSDAIFAYFSYEAA